MLDLDVAIENRGRATRVHIIPQTLYPEGALLGEIVARLKIAL